MARATRSKAAKTAAADTKPESKKKKQRDGSTKTAAQKHNALRRKLYKKARRLRQIQALEKSTAPGEHAALQKDLSALKGQILQAWTPKKRDVERMQALEALVEKQQAEIQALRSMLLEQGESRLTPPPPPPAAGAGDSVEAPDSSSSSSSPVKILQEQLLSDAAAQLSSAAGGQQHPTTVVEVEEVVESAAPEEMEGVEQTTVTATSIEQQQQQHVEYPTLPSVEEGGEHTVGQETVGEVASTPRVREGKPSGQHAHEVEEAGAATPHKGTPLKLAIEEVRDSSADSNAGTPRNLRRSPRKRSTKRRSFAGHSYAV